MSTPVTAALVRSYLFAPGSDERLLGKVFNAGADAVVLDLEDAVSDTEKLTARRLVSGVLQSKSRDEDPAIYVRINSVASGLWRDDIEAVTRPALQGIRLAKAESAAEVIAVAEELNSAEKRAGLPAGSIRITPTIESANGVLAAGEIAKAPRVEALAFGHTDFVRDIGADPDAQQYETLYARSLLVLVSRAAGIKPPIAPVYTQIKDIDGLRQSTEAARRLGFFGRSCIHPTQLPVVHQVFTPTPEQTADAREIVLEFERAAAMGRQTILMTNGQFVDLAVVQRARAVLALAETLTKTKGSDER
jgi:citrate lyase subunit beta/citryl-CoA lyase